MVTLLTTAGRLVTSQRISLVQGAIRGIEGPASIELERGVAWITQSGDSKDYVISAGQHWSTVRPGKIVVQAMESCDFRIC